MKYSEIQLAAYEANQLLPALGLAVFTFGNASAADQERRIFAIKPSGVPYSELSPEKMVLVDFDGHTVAGDLNPSSDTPTHAYLYRSWSHIGGVVHTHSLYATAWAQAQLPIPVLGTTHADYLPVDVPCAPVLADELIAHEYEKNTGEQIVEHFDRSGLDPARVSMALVAGHAPFTWGASAGEAVHNSAALEYIAHLAWMTRDIRPETSRLKETLVRKHFDRKHGTAAYYGQASAGPSSSTDSHKPN